MQRAPVFNVPPAVTWLALAFAAVHAFRQFLGEEAEAWLLLAFAFIPARYGPLAEVLPGGLGACFWTPVTYAFLHADFVHLIVNLVWMASFGSALARRFGSARFLALSLISAVAGAGLHYAFHMTDEGLVIGASGAVSGMMAATACFAFSPGGPLAGGRSPAAYCIPAEPLARVFTSSRALAFILIWFAINFLFGAVGGLVPGVSGPIAWEAHIGGFVAGLVAFRFLDPIPREPQPGDSLAS
jgi:membrane associated rhomboid family serine protease